MGMSPADFYPPGPPVAGPAADQVARDAAAAAQATANAALPKPTGAGTPADTDTVAGLGLDGSGPEFRRRTTAMVHKWGATAAEVARPLSSKLGELVSVRDFGAKGDGSSDDTAAFVAAAARGGTVRVPYTGQPYKVGPTVFAKPTVLDFEAGAEVKPLFDTTTQQYLFRFQAPDSGLVRPKISGVGPVTVSNSKTLIYADPGAVRFFVESPRLLNCQWSDGLRGITSLIRTNGIYTLASDCEIRGGVLDDVWGPGIFATNLSNLSIRGVRFKNVRWYNINLDEDVSEFDIDGCVFKYDESYGCYWGGLINMMSQPTSPAPLVVRDGSVRGCKFSGLVSYGAVVRAQSCARLLIEGNDFRDINAGSGAASPSVQYIGIDWRYAGAPTNQDNGPWSQIKIINNQMRASTGIHQAIYAKCSQVGNTRNASKFLEVRGNTAESVDASNNFDSFCGFHGLYGGMDHVNILDNTATVRTRTGTPVPGAIGVVSNDVQGSVNHVMIDGNDLEDIGTIDPAAVAQLAVYVQGWADQVHVGNRNRAKNFLRAWRIGTNVTNLTGGDGFRGEACRYEPLLVSAPGDGPTGITRNDNKPASGIWLDGDIVWKRNQSLATAAGWVCTTAGGAVSGNWAAGATYAVGAWIASVTGTPHAYEVITQGPGTTSVEPTHTVGDNAPGADGYVYRYRHAAVAYLGFLPNNQAS